MLTEEQVKIADALQKYMGGQLAELGNQASMEVYGYRKFTEPNYFPIQVDRNQTQRDIAKEAQAQTIAGRGFTKGTVPRANNAVMVGSIFDIFASHVNDMATYRLASHHGERTPYSGLHLPGQRGKPHRNREERH